MAKTTNVNIRLEPHIKESAEELFSVFGLTISDAVNIFLHQSLLVGGMPFSLRLENFNEETIAAMKEARDIASGKVKAKAYTSVDEFFDEIEEEITEEENKKC